MVNARTVVATRSCDDPAESVLRLDPPEGWGQPMAILVDIDDGYLHDLVVSVLRHVGAHPAKGLPTLVITDDLRRLRAARSRLALHVLVSPTGVRVVQDNLAAVSAGQAHGVIRAEEIARLPAALVATSSGFAPVSRSLLEESRHAPVLTERQRRVLDGVTGGLTNRTIARACGVSIGTIKREVGLLLRLLGVRSRVELVAKATELGVSCQARRDGQRK